jgi:hypothetical protein
MVAREHLLDSKQMAQFVADGYLRFDEVVPDELNKAAYKQMEAGDIERPGAGTKLGGVWQDSAIGQIIRLPQIQGAMASLVGSDPLYDHHAVHIVQPSHKQGQVWHADAIIDLRLDFDIQFFYFCHDTPREMGGTMILPGSQYRRVSESDIGRYQNFLGQLPMVCKAGTVMVCHHGIWHCAQPNLTQDTRYMFKLRLNPTQKQEQLWNTDDVDAPEIGGILGTNHEWYGNESRIEVVNRIRQWRHLTGNEKFDVSYWMGRLENAPSGTA